MDNQLQPEIFLQKITVIMKAVLGVEDISVSMDTKLVNGVGQNDLDLSSIDYVQFLVKVEDIFDIVFDFSIVIYKISDIYDYIINLQKGSNDLGEK